MSALIASNITFTQNFTVILLGDFYLFVERSPDKSFFFKSVVTVLGINFVLF